MPSSRQSAKATRPNGATRTARYEDAGLPTIGQTNEDTAGDTTAEQLAITPPKLDEPGTDLATRLDAHLGLPTSRNPAERVIYVVAPPLAPAFVRQAPRVKSTLRTILSPKVLIPVVFAVVLIGIVLSLGDIRKVGQDIVHFPPGDAALFLGLTVLYETIRGVQWLYFLKGMKVKVARRRAIFAFIGGEATKSLPAGNYFENYLLEREAGVAVAYTASGTTITILLEVVICVVYLSVVGIRGWGWLRPVILLGSLLVVLTVIALARLDLHAHLPGWLANKQFFRWAAEQWKTFSQGAAAFVTPKRLGVGLALAAAYLAAAGTQYYVVIRAIGHDHVGYFDAVAAYLFGLGAGLILPVPTDIGVQEITGLGALKAMGMQVPNAVPVTILFRVFNLVSSLVIAVIAFVVLHREFRDAFASRDGSGSVPEEAATGG